MKDYSCAVCKQKGLHKNRICFLYPELRTTAGDPILPIPRLDDNGRQALNADRRPEVEFRELDEEGLLEEIWRLQRALPENSAYQIAGVFFKRVCIEALVDPIVERLLEAESEVTQYHIDINDPKIRLELLGFEMGLSDLLEAFTCVRGTRNAFERNEIEVMQQNNAG